jgi:hypothetical protein
MTRSQALALYAVLVTYADALPSDADRFAAYLCDGASWHEWRFCGSLGMGGKLYDSGGRLRVGCYSEDETPKRRATIKRTQAEIDALVGEWERAGVEGGAK